MLMIMVLYPLHFWVSGATQEMPVGLTDGFISRSLRFWRLSFHTLLSHHLEVSAQSIPMGALGPVRGTVAHRRLPDAWWLPRSPCRVG